MKAPHSNRVVLAAARENKNKLLAPAIQYWLLGQGPKQMHRLLLFVFIFPVLGADSHLLEGLAGGLELLGAGLERRKVSIRLFTETGR